MNLHLTDTVVEPIINSHTGLWEERVIKASDTLSKLRDVEITSGCRCNIKCQPALRWYMCVVQCQSHVSRCRMLHLMPSKGKTIQLKSTPTYRRHQWTRYCGCMQIRIAPSIVNFRRGQKPKLATRDLNFITPPPGHEEIQVELNRQKRDLQQMTYR